MPELPEIESLRRSLGHQVVGRKVVAVEVHRSSMVTGENTPAALLCGHRLISANRHGKQLAIYGQKVSRHSNINDHPCVCVHLGMSGSLRRVPDVPALESPTCDVSKTPVRHVHVTWLLDDGSRLLYRDPRRFGGLWTFSNTKALWNNRWHRLGTDALRITPQELHSRLKTSKRPIKSALLDQQVIAGLGNIYVDELLFACRLHPLIESQHIDLQVIRKLIRRLRTLLQRAITIGGSTFRDYADANGQAGGFQAYHRVYGRAGKPCIHCNQPLMSISVSGRTTVYCSVCQKPDASLRD